MSRSATIRPVSTVKYEANNDSWNSALTTMHLNDMPCTDTLAKSQCCYKGEPNIFQRGRSHSPEGMDDINNEDQPWRFLLIYQYLNKFVSICQ